MESTILVVEDDADIRALLKLYLESEGFLICEAGNGALALEKIHEYSPDMIILDIMMPEMDGFEFTKTLRRYSNIPILILSARNQDNDKILGLNFGADDYITKPFNPLEVVARVKAQLRRKAINSSSVLSVRDLELDTSCCQLYKNKQEISLTPTEYKILLQLMRSPGKIFTKIQLYEGIAGQYFESNDSTMMVHISKLREKIEDDPKNPEYIMTIRGLGYKIEK